MTAPVSAANLCNALLRFALQPMKLSTMKIMKASTTKPAPTENAPVFPQTLHHVQSEPKEAAPGSQSPKRDKIFSKSRDTREDRGTRQMKTTHNSQSFPHGR
jgi:hypothetical protein